MGDQTFDALPDQSLQEPSRRFDNWAAAREEEAASATSSDEEEDDEQEVEPYEKVRIRVTFPKLGEAKNELVLERWVPWEQVHGETEDAATEVDAAEGADDLAPHVVLAREPAGDDDPVVLRRAAGGANHGAPLGGFGERRLSDPGPGGGHGLRPGAAALGSAPDFRRSAASSRPSRRASIAQASSTRSAPT